MAGVKPAPQGAVNRRAGTPAATGVAWEGRAAKPCGYGELRVEGGLKSALRWGQARLSLGVPDSTTKLARVLMGAPGLVTKGTVR